MFINQKRIVDFILVLTELTLLGVMAEALRAKIDRKSVLVSFMLPSDNMDKTCSCCHITVPVN